MACGTPPRGIQLERMAEVTSARIVSRCKGPLPGTELGSVGKLAPRFCVMGSKDSSAVKSLTQTWVTPPIGKTYFTVMNGLAYVVPLLHKLRRGMDTKMAPYLGGNLLAV